MIRPARPVLIWLASVAFWSLAAVVGLTAISCSRASPPPAGTAQAAAAGAQARVDTAAQAVDKAGADVARLAGEAAAAEARAKATGIKADIDAAVEARVRVVAAEAVHAALVGQEVAARTIAEEASKRAEQERLAEQAAQDYRFWVRLCRLVGGAGIVAGFLLAAVIAWATKNPRAGLWPGGILAGAGALVIALGPATAWMPWLVVAAAGIAGLWWALGHRRAAEAAIAGSRAVDAIEREVSDKAKAAKTALGDALAGAGLAAVVEASRGPSRDWSTP